MYDDVLRDSDISAHCGQQRSTVVTTLSLSTDCDRRNLLLTAVVRCVDSSCAMTLHKQEAFQLLFAALGGDIVVVKQRVISRFGLVLSLCETAEQNRCNSQASRTNYCGYLLVLKYLLLLLYLSRKV